MCIVPRQVKLTSQGMGTGWAGAKRKNVASSSPSSSSSTTTSAYQLTNLRTYQPTNQSSANRTSQTAKQLNKPKTHSNSNSNSASNNVNIRLIIHLHLHLHPHSSFFIPPSSSILIHLQPSSSIFIHPHHPSASCCDSKESFRRAVQTADCQARLKLFCCGRNPAGVVVGRQAGVFCKMATAD